MTHGPDAPQERPLNKRRASRRRLNKIDELEIQAHLKEYEMLSSSIRTDIERLDRIIGIYSVAVFGMIAFFLRESDLSGFLSKIDAQADLIGLVLIIPIINSVLLIHAVSTFQVILVKARCSTYVIGERLRSITQRNILVFDKIRDLDKRTWLKERSFIGMAYCLLSVALSLSILLRFSNVFYCRRGILPILIWLVSCATVSVSLGFLAQHRYVNKNFAVLHKGDITEPSILKLWVVSAIIFIVLLSCLGLYGRVRAC
jgi:hypothetical protein